MFTPYALNFGTNIFSYGPSARLIRAYSRETLANLNEDLADLGSLILIYLRTVRHPAKQPDFYGDPLQFNRRNKGQ